MQLLLVVWSTIVLLGQDKNSFLALFLPIVAPAVVYQYPQNDGYLTQPSPYGQPMHYGPPPRY